MLTFRRPPEGGPFEREVVGATQARHHTGPEHAELTSQHRQREHRAIRRATVAVPLDPPPDAHERGTDRRELLGEGGDVGRVDAGHLRGARQRPLGRAVDQRVGSGRVRVDERSVDQPVAIQMTHHAEHERDVGAGPQREVPVGAARHRGATGIDDDEPRALSPSLLHERREVDVRDRGVRAPHDHELAVHHVQRIGREHRSERRAARPRPQSRRRSCAAHGLRRSRRTSAR